MDTTKLLLALFQAGAFIATFAAIAAGIIMTSVRKKFGTGLLASGFRAIAVGVFFIAGGIIIDSVSIYFVDQSQLSLLSLCILIVKEVFFVIGTYSIVIGVKKTGDKLESLSR